MMSTKTVLISKDELNAAKLQEIFRHASFDVSVDANRHYVTMDGVKIATTSLGAEQGRVAYENI
jgi:hypothetical protein